jgi:glycosyltransferase involved in cell wall biosynthesis
VIVTDRCGSIGDIVLEGENSLIFKPGDVAGLAAHLDRMIEEPELRAQMASRSLEIIKGWNYERGVEGVREALQSLC